MEIDIDPIYIKDADINFRGNKLLCLCNFILKLYPGEVHGAQLYNGNWLVYVRSNRTRAALIVSGLNVNGVNIVVHDTNPQLAGGRRSERVIIKDLPATLPPERIMGFLQGYPQLTTRSRVLYAKERVGGEEMSPFINGDRLVYVRPDVTPPLPKETVICGFPCRIWHASQKNYCKRCASHGHRTNDVDACESYDADSPVAAWRADNNPLSNCKDGGLPAKDKWVRWSAGWVGQNKTVGDVINSESKVELLWEVSAVITSDGWHDHCRGNFMYILGSWCCPKFGPTNQTQQIFGNQPYGQVADGSEIGSLTGRCP